ncbi:unnamed protein product, partial [Medioppia subpectinata]
SAQKACAALGGECEGVNKTPCCATGGHGLMCRATKEIRDRSGHFLAYGGVCERACQGLWQTCFSTDACCTELGLKCQIGSNGGTNWGQSSGQNTCAALGATCGGVAKKPCCVTGGHGLVCNANNIIYNSSGQFVAYSGVCQRACQPLWGTCFPSGAGYPSASECCTELGLKCQLNSNAGTNFGQCVPSN